MLIGGGPVNAAVRRMHILTWNCNGALRNKLEALDALKFDVAVIQECEDPDHSTNALYKAWAKNYLWAGKNKHKGLGVFAAPEVKLAPVDLDLGQLESFLPCRIQDSFLLVAVWTRQANSPTFQYIGQLWKLIQAHRAVLSTQPTVIAGDLNSNVRWDKWDRWWNHTDVVRELSEMGLESVYHRSRGIPQGSEPEPTFFLQRNPAKPYHIDYAFAPVAWLDDCSAWVGESDKWLQWSDHMPLLVRVDLTDDA
jgi:exonuclease III